MICAESMVTGQLDPPLPFSLPSSQSKAVAAEALVLLEKSTLNESERTYRKVSRSQKALVCRLSSL
jgi:hypothetical protein